MLISPGYKKTLVLVGRAHSSSGGGARQKRATTAAMSVSAVPAPEFKLKAAGKVLGKRFDVRTSIQDHKCLALHTCLGLESV